MDKKKVSWWPSKRRFIQLYSALLYNAHLKGFVTGNIYRGETKALCVPGLNCYSCPGAVGACPLGALQNALGSLHQRTGFYMFGVLMLYGLLLGRTVCGWLCPLGLLQELLHKLPTPKLRKNRGTRCLSYLKYVLLAVFVVALPLWYGFSQGLPLPGFCKFICPAGTLEGAMGLLPARREYLSMLGAIFTWKFVLMLFIGLACVFCYRSFCRFLCPLGAIYGMCNRLSLVGVKVDPSRCTGCGACLGRCRMDVKAVGDHECIHCGKCREVCTQGAISLRAGSVTLRGNRLIYGAAVALLCGVLLFAHARGRERFDSSAPVGYGVGEQLADFTVQCLDGSRFRLSDHRGQVTVINLWATYCGPCVQELPRFVQLSHDHEGEVAVLAVHAAFCTDDVPAFLEGRGWDIPFAVDTQEEEIFGLVNGSDALPQTIVLNRRGEVIFNRVGSVTAELLEQLYQQGAEG